MREVRSRHRTGSIWATLGGSPWATIDMAAGWDDRGRHGHDAGRRGRLGSLMRHILAPGAIPALTGGVVDPAPPALLVASAGRVEGGPPGPVGAVARAVAVAAIADAAEGKQSPTVGPGADHHAERVHRSSRARREGVDTREDLCELWSLGPAESRPRGLARGSGGGKPPGPHPLSAPVRIDLPHLTGRCNPAPAPCFASLRPVSRIPHFSRCNDTLARLPDALDPLTGGPAPRYGLAAGAQAPAGGVRDGERGRGQEMGRGQETCLAPPSLSSKGTAKKAFRRSVRASLPTELPAQNWKGPTGLGCWPRRMGKSDRPRKG